MSDSKSEKLTAPPNTALAHLENQSTAAISDVTKAKLPYNSTNQPIASQKSSYFGVWLAMLIALTALGAAAYGVYTAYELKNALGAVLELEQRVTRLATRIDQWQSVAAQTTTEIDTKLSKQQLAHEQVVAKLKQTLVTELGLLKQEVDTSSEDWLLAEAEYLIRLAQHRIMMAGDPKGAILLLQAADSIMLDTEGMLTLDLRQALAQDIANLQAVEGLDINGIFVQLSLLGQQVKTLQQKQRPDQLPNIEQAANAEQLGAVNNEATSQADKLLNWLSRVGTRLTDLVDYRLVNKAITPILPPQEVYYLRQNLILKLQTAQLGLLRDQQSIYRQSLNDASAWIVNYFDQENSTVTAILAAITELQRIDIEREVPDISDSLFEIHKLSAKIRQNYQKKTASAESL